MTSFCIRGVKENQGEIQYMDQLNEKFNNFGLNSSNCNPLFLLSDWFMKQLQKCKICQKIIKHPLESMSQVRGHQQKLELPGFEYLRFFGTLWCPLFFWQNLQQYLQTTHRNQKIGGTRSCRARNRQNMRLVLKMGQNDFNSVLRPRIKILSTLFTLQLLILPTRDPFYGQKS